jgi:hypothetical protein
VKYSAQKKVIRAVKIVHPEKMIKHGKDDHRWIEYFTFMCMETSQSVDGYQCSCMETLWQVERDERMSVDDNSTTIITMTISINNDHGVICLCTVHLQVLKFNVYIFKKKNSLII